MFELTPYARRYMRSYNPFPEFRTDITEKDGNYVLEADLPGVKKEDIHIDLKDDTMVISATRNNTSEEKDSEGRVIRSERSSGSYSRSFDISTVDADKITAEYVDGVLKLTMPKKQPEEPQTRRLEIK